MLLVGPDGRLLLFRVLGRTGRWAWVPPGGAIEDGETPAAAAGRELAEETGLSLPVGSELATTREPPRRPHDGRLRRAPLRGRTATSAIDTGGFTDDERRRVERFAWWSLPDIERSTEDFFPKDVPRVARELVAITGL